MSAYAEILAALQSDGPVARDDVQRWIESGDLLAWGGVYRLLDDAYARVEPEYGDDTFRFMRDYLLRCLEENPLPGEFVHGGYEAAWELASVLKAWRRRGGRAAEAIRGIAVELEKIYRRGDDATRNRVLCGVLEHVFEDSGMRPHFTNWDRDPGLREAFRLAVEWGATHE
jgi:hypothetical protein